MELSLRTPVRVSALWCGMIKVRFCWLPDQVFLHGDPGRVVTEAILAIKLLLHPSLIEAKGAIIEGDCMNVLNYCSNTLRRSFWLDGIFQEVDLSILTEFNQVLFHHVQWEANPLADFCAKFRADL
ncbi:hypothetical protein KSP39_PZI014113 [Platanthera zijinensis]|uniref:RNase H type-1 domain-containing protein n=1 Tax=Platanthera zijinensis TaxID=2320716 RepID=A0AAP0G301_9ASPA